MILLPAMAGGERTLTPSLLETVGSTPLVELPRLAPHEGVRIYAKLEGQNPTGSIKDRVAKAMIEAAEASGELEPGRELLEPTSGNTGISLAFVARLKGYPLTCVLPENATPERVKLLELYGARLVLLPGLARARTAPCGSLCSMAERDPRWFMPFQYGNEANPRAHYEGTGAEIADALPQVDALVAGLGTGGTLMGAGDRLRESFPELIVAAAEPLQGDLVYGLRSLADGYVPPILDVSKLDRKVLVTNEESVAGLRALLEREAIFAGVSSGAVIHVARRIAEELEEGVVVAILADGGWKYLSADFWTQPARRGGRDDGRPPLVVIPAEVRSALVEHAEAELPERGLRPARLARRRRGVVLPGAKSGRQPLPLRAGDRSRGLVPRGRRLRARRLPLAPVEPAAALAHRRRVDRPLGRQAVRDPLPPHRRAGGLDDRGRADREPGARASAVGPGTFPRTSCRTGMKTVTLLTSLLTAAVLVGCGDPDSPDGGAGGGGTRRSRSTTPSPSATDKPLLVSGNLLALSDQVRLCSALAESFPPQCGGSSLAVEGLELEEVEDLVTEGDVSWTDRPIQLLGVISDGTLTVSENAS